MKPLDSPISSLLRTLSMECNDKKEANWLDREVVLSAGRRTKNTWVCCFGVFFTLNTLTALGSPKQCSTLLLTQHRGEGCTEKLEQLQERISSCFARGYYCNFWELVSKATANMSVSCLLSMKNHASIVSWYLESNTSTHSFFLFQPDKIL